MQFNTKFNIGDKAWAYEAGRAVQLTIGQIRVEYTKTDDLLDDDCSIFDNYKPQPERLEEQYMCVETGIGSGSIYTLGKHIFASEEECKRVNAERIAEHERQLKEAAQRQRKQKLSEEANLRARLAEIEALKAAAPETVEG